MRNGFADRSIVFVRILTILLAASLSGCQLLGPLPGNPTIFGSIEPEVLVDLKAGKLLEARDRLEPRFNPRECPVTRGPETARPGAASTENALSDKELSVLCDIFLHHLALEEGRRCLCALEARGISAARINDKLAWADYLTGNFHAASDRTRRAATQGGRYIHALSQARLGDMPSASRLADAWVKADDPTIVFQGAKLYALTGQFDKAHAALTDPFRRLAQSYGLSEGKDLFGQHIPPADLKSDPFQLMRYGILNRFSFAPPENIYVETLLAETEVELGLSETARSRLEKLALDERLPAYRDAQWRVYYLLGEISRQEGNTAVAERRYQDAIAIIESGRSLLTTESQRSSYFGGREGPYQAMVALKLAQGDIPGAFEYAERNRGRALVEMLATVNRFGPRGPQDYDIAAHLNDYARNEIAIAEMRRQPESPATESRLRYLNDEGRAMLERMARYSPPLRALVTVPDTDLRAVQRSLFPGEKLLYYVQHSEGLTLIVIGKASYDDYRLDVASLQPCTLMQAIRRFSPRLSVGGDKRERDSCSTSQDILASQLYDALIAPASANLEDNDMLTIVPVGALHYLPFAALRSPVTDRYLVERHSIATLPSADIRKYFINPRRSGEVLTLGNPIVLDRNEKKLPDLPKAAEEAVWVLNAARRAGKSGPPALVEQAATTDKLLSEAPGKELVHIASHGRFREESVLDSGIQLAKRTPDDDLTVQRLLQISEPWKARLVVLSSCESGVKEVRPGENIIGLERGLMYAGTAGTVTSLWPVGDASTFEFMKKFYRAYLGGNDSAAKALRKAQVESIKGSPRDDWAAFTYMGLHR